MLVSVRATSDLGVAEFLLGVAADAPQARDAVDGVDCQTETVRLVVHRQFHWGVDIALLLVSPHVQRLVCAGISQTVNQPRVSVEIENDRLISGE